MTRYCYTPMDAPTLFYAAGECGDIRHDWRVTNGDMARDGDQVISAVLMQLGSDRVVNGERGWWGDQFLGFPIGNTIWTHAGKKDDPAAIEAAIRTCLDPIVAQGFIDAVRVKSVQTVSGRTYVVDLIKNDAILYTVER